MCELLAERVDQRHLFHINLRNYNEVKITTIENFVDKYLNFQEDNDFMCFFKKIH